MTKQEWIDAYIAELLAYDEADVPTEYFKGVHDALIEEGLPFSYHTKGDITTIKLTEVDEDE